MDGDEPSSRVTDVDLVTEVALMPAVSHAVPALVLLDVPDLLSEGPMSVRDLASCVAAASVRPLRQLLRTAATTGLFRSIPEDRFALTDEGQRLTSGHPSSARDLILIHLSPAFQRSYGWLDTAVRSGRTAFQLEHGRSFFDHLEQDEAAHASFNRMMGAYLGSSPQAVARSYDFSGARTIVDVGGGIGTQLRAILDTSPQTRGVLFDTPAVIAKARQQLTAEGQMDRLSLQEGDFFDSVPGGAQVYVLSHIIHDWDDEDAVLILKRCADVCTEGSRVLVVEEIVPEGDDRHPVKMLDVALLSGFGGGERTLDEFDALFTSAGLRRVAAIDTGSTVTLLEVVRADAIT